RLRGRARSLGRGWPDGRAIHRHDARSPAAAHGAYPLVELGGRLRDGGHTVRRRPEGHARGVPARLPRGDPRDRDAHGTPGHVAPWWITVEPRSCGGTWR